MLSCDGTNENRPMQKHFFFVLATLLPLGSPAAAQDLCDAITCDCENISAGLLTNSWRQDCNNCQASLRQACAENINLIQPWLSLTRGGTCDRRCSVTGPNTYPQWNTYSDNPPGTPLPDNGATPTNVTEFTWDCPDGSTRTYQRDGNDVWFGCEDAGGARIGSWFLVAADGEVTLVEDHN